MGCRSCASWAETLTAQHPGVEEVRRALGEVGRGVIPMGLCTILERGTQAEPRPHPRARS